MDALWNISAVYDSFAEHGYEELALDPATYPLVPVIKKVHEEYGVVQKGKKVLDLGCGPGILKDLTEYAQYSGVDLSEEMLTRAANRGYSELIQASIQEYAEVLPTASFDSVICFSAAYFLSPKELDAFIANMERIAKSFWLVTFDSIPEDVAADYADNHGIPLYDHTNYEVSGATDRFIVRGWKSPVTGKPLPMHIVVKKK